MVKYRRAVRNARCKFQEIKHSHNRPIHVHALFLLIEYIGVSLVVII